MRANTLMFGSNPGFQTRVAAICLLTSGLKGTFSMTLHRDLGVPQKTAWRPAHRIRPNFAVRGLPFQGPVEVDDTYVGGKRKDMHAVKRKQLSGRGGAGRTAVAGRRDRATKQVSAQVVPATDRATLHAFVAARVAPKTQVCTDDARASCGLPCPHESVRQLVGEYVCGQASTTGIESFWATLQCGNHGVHRQMSPHHLPRYVRGFAGRRHARDLDTLDRMALIARGLAGKRLRYIDRTAA